MDSIIKTIKINYDSLSPNHQEIATFIINNPQSVINMTVKELAHHTLSVQSSIISFCKKIGLSGFSELKFLLSNDTSSYQDELTILCQPFIAAKKLTLTNNYKKALIEIINAEKIYIMAFQMSQIPSKDFYFRMRKLYPSKMIYFESYEEQARMLSLVTDKDLILMVSNSGECNEIIKFQQKFKSNCTQILVTNHFNSTLSDYATIELATGFNEIDPVHFKEIPTLARYSLMHVLETIFNDLMELDYQQNIERIKSISRYFNI